MVLLGVFWMACPAFCIPPSISDRICVAHLLCRTITAPPSTGWKKRQQPEDLGSLPYLLLGTICEYLQSLNPRAFESVCMLYFISRQPILLENYRYVVSRGTQLCPTRFILSDSQALSYSLASPCRSTYCLCKGCRRSPRFATFAQYN
jgi:hypothetical protein